MFVRLKNMLLTLFLALPLTAGADEPRFERLVQMGVPVVIDKVTGLTWQGCHMGRKGLNCNMIDDSVVDETITWLQAGDYCADLHYGVYHDWRLPEAKELFSIAETYENYTDDHFPGMKYQGSFWTSTTNVEDPLKAWTTSHVFSGSSYLINIATKEGGAKVRCVRNSL